MNERQLGDKWARRMRRTGASVQKLPASSLAGIPDWLLCYPSGGQGVVFVEAKRRNGKRTAYRPKQLTRAQRFFLNRVSRSGGHAAVLVLDEDGYVLMSWKRASRPMSGAEFEIKKERY